jgi:GAF domain-containing protein
MAATIDDRVVELERANAELRRQLDACGAELKEARDQQTATAEVLQVINSSPGDLAPVFDAMLEKALRLCDAALGVLFIRDGELFRAAATLGLPAPLEDFLRNPFKPDQMPLIAGVIQQGQVLHVHDAADTDGYYQRLSSRVAGVELGGVRTVLYVPLTKDGQVLGVFVIFRQEVRPFSEKQIALVQNFAAQAVIAMENARLITETREALEQQTATAEVLQVINSSPGDLAPVFDAILEKARSLCGAVHAALVTYDGEHFRAVATYGVPEPLDGLLRTPFRPEPDSPHELLLKGQRLIHIADQPVVGGPGRGSQRWRASVDVGSRTLLWVPLRKEGALLGYINASRWEVRPFSDKEIALLQNFAAQAVIAMENARLLTETREALEQQTATAEVLQVINSSPGDLAPVFDAILEKAHSLCEAPRGGLILYDGEYFRAVAVRGFSGEFADRLRQGMRGSETYFGAPLLAGERFIHISDQAVLEHPNARAGILAGTRTLLSVPLRKGDALLGMIVAGRTEVCPFTDKQIALLENFAAQAVIAMENARLLTETHEALEQQTATAEVLQVINSSPGDLAPVFDAMLEKAMHLCEAAFGILWTYDGERLHSAGMRGIPDAFADFACEPLRPGPETGLGRVLRGERLIHITDIKAEDSYRSGDRLRVATVELAGARTLLVVPLRKDSAVLGAIAAYRQEVRPFTDKQIALLQNFAAQAVIAMENARLLGELRQRTGDLEESLEYQTAISDVLKVISRSTFDLDAVMEAVVNSAIRLCRADHAGIYRNENGQYRWAGGYAPTSAYEEHERDLVILPGPGTVVGRAALEGHAVQIADAWTDPLYEAKDDAREGGVHTMLGVPLLREGSPIGVIGLARKRVELFTDKQIELVTTFADQAVIAIENARLLNDLRQRTSDLQESLEYQTATSDVLKVISQSTFDLGPVLGNVIETALRLCRAHMGSIFRLEDGVYRWAVGRGLEPAYQEIEMRTLILAGAGTLVGRAALEGRAVQIADAMADPLYAVKDEASLARARTMLGVPLLREGAPIGVIAMARDRVEPFSEKEVALVTTFADQAVIAIENARLFDELRERTAELGRSVEELKMLSEVGRAVSSTLDLSAVLSTILTASLGMTWATAGAIFRYIRAERAFRLVEAVGWDEALLGSVGDLSIAENETAMSEAASRRTPIQLTDLAELPSTRLRDASLAAGLHSVLIVPLVGPERIFGALVLQRREAGEFPAETVRLMQTLASQSVLAIQNARLFREIADKSEQLALASQHKSQFLANMSHELRTPLNAILGYAELLVDGIYGVLPEKAQGVLERVQNNGKHLLALINDVLDLAKIEAGQLTLTLEDYALAEVVRGVVIATEPLAVAKGLKFTAIVQEGMPMAHGDARRVSQVLLNLAGNAIKFTDAGEVEINASAANGQFVLTVRDTGPGIADADQERIFGEFQQIDNSDTRRKGGTGLGLAISRRMVEIQGGLISVDSVPGAGSTFRVVLPVHVEPALEEAA